MYTTDLDHSDGAGPDIEPGTSLLISGPPMVGKRDLAVEVLSAGHRTGDAVLLITTGGRAERMIDEFEARVPSIDRDHIGVVDCTGRTKQQAIRDLTTHQVASPGDLTGISIGASKLLQNFADNDVANVRHGLVSVSTLLQYLELTTVFKFIHVYTGRIASTDGFGVFTLDSSAHDPETVNTIEGGFDAVIELRETDTGEREIRSRDLPGVSAEWHPFASE